jgi:hypothetical protein
MWNRLFSSSRRRMRRDFSSSLLMGLTAGDYERHNLSVPS